MEGVVSVILLLLATFVSGWWYKGKRSKEKAQDQRKERVEEIKKSLDNDPATWRDELRKR